MTTPSTPYGKPRLSPADLVADVLLTEFGNMKKATEQATYVLDALRQEGYEITVSADAPEDHDDDR